ncbi:putative motility protein [Novipirellula sp.]|uniref:putative motility protein n=1 Tax=Novipirellula sp. TaxID=2795430 RepID=UPI00356178EF
MSSIHPAVASVLNARNDATQQQVQMAVIAKGLDVQEQTGDAINAMLEQAKQVQTQIASGHLDVRV